MAAHKVQGLGDVRKVTPIVLDGKKLDARIENGITSSSLERTIAGTSTLTLTVTDPERFLLKGGYYERQADLLVDDLWFRMITMDKVVDDYTITFEDREIALLRRHRKHRQVSRSKMTRAEFAASLVHEEPHIKFVAPELHTKQAVGNYSATDKQTLANTKTRGIAKGASLTVKGKPATAAQIALMNEVLDVAESKGAGKRASLAMIVANIGEASYSKTAKNPKSGAAGLFQLLPSTEKSIGISHGNVTALAAYFLDTGFTGAGGAIALARAHPDWSPGTIASKVEGSDQGGGFYDSYRKEADAIYDAYGGVETGPSSDGEPTYVKQFLFSRGKPGGPAGEDTWTCIQRLATEVHWRCFCVAGVVYFISDYDLIRSEPRMTITEKTSGIDNIDFSLDTSHKVPDELTITARAARWAAPPGTVALVNQDFGAAAGAWIVSDITRADIYEDETVIVLTRPKAPLNEPASQVATRSSGGSATLDGGVNSGATQAGADGTLKADSHVLKAYRKAQSIDKKHLPYIFGGGHGSTPGLNVDSGIAGYDCSGAVSAILNAAGLLSSPLTTSGLINWGQAGEGKYMTVWVKETGNPSTSHTVITFDLPKEGHVMFEAGGGNNNPHPVGFHPLRSDLATTFKPRHWQGT